MKQAKPKKTTKPNTEEPKISTNETPKFFEYLDIYSFRMKPANENFVRNLAVKLVEWAKTDDNAFKLSQFYLNEGITRRDFYNWIERFDFLKDAHDTALMFLGDRREVGAIKRKLDTQMISFAMPNYDPQWREMVTWRAKLKAEQQAEVSQAPKMIVLERYPESPLVPSKLTPEEVAEQVNKSTRKSTTRGIHE